MLRPSALIDVRPAADANQLIGEALLLLIVKAYIERFGGADAGRSVADDLVWHLAKLPPQPHKPLDKPKPTQRKASSKKPKDK